MNIAQDLKFTRDHSWLRLEGDIVYVGITDYAQQELGEIVFVDVPSEGESLEAEAVYGSVEAVKTVSDLLLPLEGDVLEVNQDLEEHPELVNQDPYGRGWIIKFKPANTEDMEGLLSYEDYNRYIAE